MMSKSVFQNIFIIQNISRYTDFTYNVIRKHLFLLVTMYYCDTVIKTQMSIFKIKINA